MIRNAQTKDLPRIEELLQQVALIHHNGRPDLFYRTIKYGRQQLEEILSDADRPVFVATDAQDRVLGYAFCILQQHPHDRVLTNIRTLYLDDLCVDEATRGQHIGTELYQHVKKYAKEIGCHNLTLHAWSCNPAAIRFYESLGMQQQMICMEQIL